MSEWLILLLLVPAIVVPVVLLSGFAGCHRVFLDPRNPVIESIEPISSSAIRLIWRLTGDSTEFERTRVPDPNQPPPAPEDPEYRPKRFFPTGSGTADFALLYDDEDLARGTSYDYRARTHAFGEESDWVGPIRATTPSNFAILLEIVQDESFGNRDTDTVKCEIAVADLTVPPFTPTRMWITLGQVSTVESVTFSKVYIGHKSAAGDLTPVLFGGMPSTVIMPSIPGMPPNTSRSDEIAFVWNETSPLILSMYFAGGPDSDLLSARTTGASDTYFKEGVDEAITADFTGYMSFPGFLSGVVKIEVAE